MGLAHIIESLKDIYDSDELRFVALRRLHAAEASTDESIGEDHTLKKPLVLLILDAAIGKRKNIIGLVQTIKLRMIPLEETAAASLY
jgi:UDP-glucose 4-epimerase